MALSLSTDGHRIKKAKNNIFGTMIRLKIRVKVQKKSQNRNLKLTACVIWLFHFFFLFIKFLTLLNKGVASIFMKSVLCQLLLNLFKRTP